MKKILFLFSFIAFSLVKTFACGNYFYAIDKEGHLVPLGYTWKFPFNKNFNLERNVKRLQKIEQKLKLEKNYMLLSDYALCLMKLGKQIEALEILVELYNHYPNDYKIAANLGTAYELNGEVDSALKYIKRDLQLNPNDHEGSEWIHVKVLETKLALRKNSAYLNDHTVLQLNAAQKKDSTILEQISIQLQERVPFTPAGPEPNNIMASLFIDLAEISANIKSVEYARVYYQIAKNYYGSQLPFLDAKIKEMGKLMNKYASVYPKQDGRYEGSQTKVGYFKYEELLTDNNPNDYKVKWDNINTDVNALLALVDFKKTSQEIKNTANSDSNSTSDGFKLIPEHDHSGVNADTSHKMNSALSNDQGSNYENNYIWRFVLGAIIILILAFITFRKRKDR